MKIVTLLCLALMAPIGSSQDTKGAADAIMRQLRTEHFDGTGYGDVITTARVLDVMSRSPRRYNELDGPWFRIAAEWLATEEIEDTKLEAWRVLGLAGTVSRRLTEARDRSLQHIADDVGTTWEAALAVTALAPVGRGPVFEEPLPDDAALAVLLAEDPSSVPVPALDSTDWPRWARGARLRGLVPDALPPLPDLGPDPDVNELIDALEVVIVLHGLEPRTSGGAGPVIPARGEPDRQVEVGLRLAWDYLEAHQSDGTFGMDLAGWSGPEPGITALSLSAMIWLSDRLAQPRPAWVDEGLDYLVGLQRADGSIHETGLAIYTTSVAIETLLDAGRPQDEGAIERARQFLIVAQSDEAEGYSSEDDPHYGGIGYGSDERPDLSNTQMALEAAWRAGTPEDDEFYAKALVFLERCQNLGESRTQRWPRKDGGTLVTGTDGGATYMPGNSPAGENELGDDTWQARSYGSMTYALTKSYLLCGLAEDDHRVVAATRWLADHWALDRNPGFDDPDKDGQGLYYYYMAMARTLARLPDGSFKSRDEQPIEWRHELIRHLIDEQRTTGSWINDRATRWWEGSPGLCTPFAILALKAAEA